jgi:hypothetical protein
VDNSGEEGKLSSPLTSSLHLSKTGKYRAIKNSAITAHPVVRDSVPHATPLFIVCTQTVKIFSKRLRC